MVEHRRRCRDEHVRSHDARAAIRGAQDTDGVEPESVDDAGRQDGLEPRRRAGLLPGSDSLGAWLVLWRTDTSQAWIEASTKGGVLLFTSSEVQKVAQTLGCGNASASLLGGMTGGIVQAYATMGFCTCMKTAEITRHKQMESGVKPPSTWKVFADIYRREGIRGINKGVNAVAVRQCTNWGSRCVTRRDAATDSQHGLRSARRIPYPPHGWQV